MTIGYVDASQDKEYLDEVFVNKGLLDLLSSTKNPRSIIIGRTGSGKTALLDELQKGEAKCISLNPEDLAINYLANNEFIKFAYDCGINLEIFYKLLWRHILIVEIVKMHYQITDKKTQETVMTRLFSFLSKNKAKEEAINYLLEWGNEFWKDSDYRITEITKKLENDIKLAIESEGSAMLPILGKTGGKLNLTTAKNASSEEKGQITKIGQEIVDRVQISKLTKVIDYLSNDVLIDEQKQYFITIDKLDENWIDEKLRYPIIKALIETAKFINEKVKSVKIVIALREDLINRVFTVTKDSTVQYEKYRDMYIPIYWEFNELKEVLERRVQKLLLNEKATNASTIYDLVTITEKFNAIDYIITLTLMRPRDLIMFFNECIAASHGKTKLTKESVLQAEIYYSEARLKAIYDEWKIDYPNIMQIIKFFKNSTPSIGFSEALSLIELPCLDFSTEPTVISDHLHQFISQNFRLGHTKTILVEVARVLHRIGIFGIKNKGTKVIWTLERPMPGEMEIDEDSSFHIHPAFHAALKVKKR